MITGMESALQATLKTHIETELTAVGAYFGTPPTTPVIPPPTPDTIVNALCKGIAEALIPFLTGNVQVNIAVVDPGTFTSPSGAVTGVGATEVTTIS